MDHTEQVILVVQAVVGALQSLDDVINVSKDIKSVAVECQEIGVFAVRIESHGDVDADRFSDALTKILQDDSHVDTTTVRNAPGSTDDPCPGGSVS